MCMEERANVGTRFRSVRSRPGATVVVVGLCTLMGGAPRPELEDCDAKE